LIVGAFLVLMVIYQMGRSSGIRSVSESVERTAAVLTEQPVVKPAIQIGRPGNAPVVGRPGNATGVNSQSSRRTPELIVQPSNGNPAIRVPLTNLSEDKLASDPPRVIETVPVVRPERVVETPPVLQATSVYDRRPSGVPSKPSELGVLPLKPLEPVSVGVAATVPVTYRQVSPKAQNVPAIPVKAPVLCDCGKVH
jgi:hypothetical protein